MFLPVTLALAVLVSGIPVYADAPWEYTLSSHSPTISYQPYADGFDPANGWSVWTSKLGFRDPTQDVARATGDIYHVTTHSGASFTISFFGTGISLFGSANASYTVSVDNTNVSPVQARDLLFQHSELQLRQHYVTLTVDDTSNAKQVAFVRAVVSTSSPSPVSSKVYAVSDPEVIRNGSWTAKSIASVPNYMSTNEYRANASLTVRGARAIAVHSLLNFGHWLYSVELDGVSMPPPAGDIFNSSSHWLIDDSVLFFANGLEPGIDHTITVTNLGDIPEWYSFTLTSFEVWYVAGSDALLSGISTSSIPTSSTPANRKANSKFPTPGVIVGVVVAIVVAFIVLGTSIWFLLRRRRARLLPQRDVDAPFTVSAEPVSDQGSTVLGVGPPFMFDRKGRITLAHKPSSDAGTSTMQPESSYATSSSVTGGAVPAVEDVAPASYQFQGHAHS